MRWQVSTDSNHRKAQLSLSTLNTVMVLPIPVMPELFYMVSIRANYRAAVRSFNYLQDAGFQIEPISSADRQRMSEIMQTYIDVQFDFVDTAIMAIAERLNIRQVCTFDHRDFSIFRPKHTDYFELIP